MAIDKCDGVNVWLSKVLGVGVGGRHGLIIIGY